MIRVELRTVQGLPWKRFGLIVIAVMVTVYTVVSIYAEVEKSLEKLFANPIMKIVIEPSVINKPDNKNIRRGSLIFFMKKAAAIAPTKDPALNAA